MNWMTMGPQAGVGCGMLHACLTVMTSPGRQSASHAAFLFAVLGILLAIFFAIILLTTVSRAFRRKKREQEREPTDVSVDAWTEAGKRLSPDNPRFGPRR